MISAGLPEYSHEFAVLTGAQTLPRALPGLLFRRPILARLASRVDLIHIDGDTASALSRQLVGSRPVVISTAGLHLLRRTRGPLASLVRRRICAQVLRSRLTICTSQAEYDELRELCGRSAPLKRIYNGVPIPTLEPGLRREARAELGLGDEDVVALMAARLEHRKHPLEAARAAAAVAEQGTRLVLLVAGDGPLAGRLQRLSGPSVRWLGFRDDVDRLIGAADFYLMPSEREGLSLGLLEAMAGSLPAIVGDGPGNPEAIGPDAGLVVPAGDIVALQRALTKMVTEPQWRRVAGERARARVVERFSLDAMLTAVKAAYEEAL